MCDYLPLKSEPYRVRLTVGRDRLEYPNDTSSPVASLLEPKLLFNSTISAWCKIYILWPERLFLGNFYVKSRLYDNKLKIFPTRHQRPLTYWWTHCSRWICLHKNHQRHVWTKTGKHHSIQPDYLSHGSARLLFSALQNWTLGTQDQNFFFASVWMILEWNISPKTMQIIF